jgi:hypothetical protein
MCATFITLALEDGADQHVIETRVTHTKKRRSAFDGYNRGLQWERMCAGISKLKITRRPMGRRVVIALPIAAGAEAAETAETEASRYSGRYSDRNSLELHLNLPVLSRRPGELASRPDCFDRFRQAWSSSTMKRAPGSLGSTQTRPPIASTWLFTIARPRPEPPRSRLRPASIR